MAAPKATSSWDLQGEPHENDDEQNQALTSLWHSYKSLFKTRPNLKRTSVAILIMLFQQWTGVVGHSDLRTSFGQC